MPLGQEKLLQSGIPKHLTVYGIIGVPTPTGIINNTLPLIFSPPKCGIPTHSSEPFIVVFAGDVTWGYSC
jgi:hypothetical protein